MRTAAYFVASAARTASHSASYLVFHMLLRTLQIPPGFVDPCLPSLADRPPSGPDWIHEIKHDGYRLMARRDPVGTRLLTRNGHDWALR